MEHEAWLEFEDGRVALYWGHFPRVDGRLDPHLIIDSCIYASGVCKPMLFSKGTCKRGECLEARVEGEWASILYTRRLLKTGDVWVQGSSLIEAGVAGLDASEARLVIGYARVCRGACKPTGQPIEVVYSDGEATILSFSSMVEADVKAFDAKGSLIFEGVCSRCRFEVRPYLITASKKVESVSSRFNRYVLVATLVLA